MSLLDAAPLALRIVLAVGGIYLALCAALWALQDRLIFHPQRLGAAPANPAAKAVSLARGGVTLQGWTVNEAAAGPVIVYFGGNAEEVSAHIDGFAARSATTVLFNSRGYGGSGGKPGEQALVADAVAIAAWARERFPHRPLVLFGLSLGSGIAALATPEAKPDALVLVSAYRSVEHIARAAYPMFPVRWLLRHPFRAESAVAAMPRTLVLAAPKDRVIRFRETEAMVRRLGGKAQLRTFDVAHGEFLFHAEVWAAVDEFLATVRA